MATIIQPYNPWRENLAVNLLGPLLTDAIKRSQDTIRNRKTNTAIGQTLSNLGAIGAQASIKPESYPAGYNDDGWEQAFHNGGTPLTQYDLGTSGLTRTQQPSQLDIRNELARTLSNPRWSMLNPDEVEKTMTPYYQRLEQAESDRRKQQASENYMNAGSERDRLNALYGGAITGDVSSDILKLAQGQYQYDNPYQQQYTQNRGQTTSYGSFDPRTGEYTPRGFYKNTLTPEQQAEMSLAQFANEIKRKEYASQAETARQANERAGYEAVLKDIEQQISSAYERMDGIKDKETLAKHHEYISNLEQRRTQVQNALAQIGQSSRQSPQGGQQYANPQIANHNYGAYIQKYADEYGVEPELIAAMMSQESGGKPNAVSHKGAQGLMQLMPDTARAMGVTDSFDPEQNIRGGVRYLAEQLKRFNGDIEKALWAYNAGPGNAAKGVLPDETRKYIPAIMAKYRKLKSQRQQTPQPAAMTPFETDAQTAQTQASQQNNEPAMFTNAQTGDTLTKSQYESLVQKMQNGELKYAKTWNELDNYLASKGYARIKEQPQQIQSGNPNWDIQERQLRAQEDALGNLARLEGDDNALKYYLQYGVLPAGFSGMR